MQRARTFVTSRGAQDRAVKPNFTEFVYQDSPPLTLWLVGQQMSDRSALPNTHRPRDNVARDVGYHSASSTTK